MGQMTMFFSVEMTALQQQWLSFSLLIVYVCQSHYFPLCHQAFLPLFFSLLVSAFLFFCRRSQTTSRERSAVWPFVLWPGWWPTLECWGGMRGRNLRLWSGSWWLHFMEKTPCSFTTNGTQNKTPTHCVCNLRPWALLNPSFSHSLFSPALSSWVPSWSTCAPMSSNKQPRPCDLRWRARSLFPIAICCPPKSPSTRHSAHSSRLCYAKAGWIVVHCICLRVSSTWEAFSGLPTI